jgi:hypothetical protein
VWNGEDFVQVMTYAQPIVGRTRDGSFRLTRSEHYRENYGLSETCANALTTARKTPAQLNFAREAQGWLQPIAARHGVDWRLLAAVAVRESGFQNIRETRRDGTPGTAFGLFQLDTAMLRVTPEQASNPQWAADYAAGLLASNMATLARSHSSFNPQQLLQATAASYNFGIDDISGKPETIDVGTTNGNYGSNVLGLMDCFN